MAKLKKKMVSFSMIPVIIFLCIITFIILLLYLFFGRAAMSTNDKYNDLVKYSNQYSESFLRRNNLLYLYVDSSNVDYYSEYMSENVITGDMNTAKNMLLAIGLEDDEKEIITQIENAWEKYIAPAEQNALNKMIQEAKPSEARKYISSNEYVSCIDYISSSQEILNTAVSSRLENEKNTYEMWESILQIVFIFILLIIIAVSFKCRSRISRLGIMIEKERESYADKAVSDVVKRRKMRNSRRFRK